MNTISLLPDHIKYLANILNTFCFGITLTVVSYFIITISMNSTCLSHQVTRFVEVPHCFNHKCTWVWWRLPSLFKLKEHGRKEKHPYPNLVICVYDGRQMFVKTLLTEGTIWVPHSVSNTNTHGSLRLCCVSILNTKDSLKLTLLCFKHQCT